MTIYCISTVVSRCVTICGWTILLLYDYSRGSRERSQTDYLECGNCNHTD